MEYVGLIGTIVGVVVGIFAVIAFILSRMDKNKHISEESKGFKAEFEYLRKGVSNLDLKMTSTNLNIQEMRDELIRIQYLNVAKH